MTMKAPCRCLPAGEVDLPIFRPYAYGFAKERRCRDGSVAKFSRRPEHRRVRHADERGDDGCVQRVRGYDVATPDGMRQVRRRKTVLNATFVEGTSDMSAIAEVDPNDVELVGRTRSGNKEAYGQLVTRYQGHVYGLAYSFVNNWADAQDIAQEAFIRAYCNLDQLRDAARFAAWLRRVTFSVAMNWLKAFRPGLFEYFGSPEDLDRLEISDFAPGPSEVVEKRELSEAVLQAVASLPPKYRVPLTMFHLDGLSYRKVSDFLDIPLGTTKSLISRARQMLRPALGAYAAETMGKAIEEVFNEHKLPREFVSKVLEGVEKLEGPGSTFIGALAAAMRAIGEDVSFDYLMGVSGVAFRLQVHQPNWCSSSPDAGVGFNCIDSAMKALGYRVDRIGPHEGKHEDIEKTREAIGRSINRGYPVVAINLMGSMDWGTIVGYEDSGKVFLCRTYYDETDAYSRVETKKCPPSVLVIGEKERTPDRRENLLRSLEIAVQLAHTERFGEYASGLNAYERWTADLLDDSRFRDLEDKRLLSLADTKGWCYRNLVGARAAAARYVRSMMEEFEGESAKHVSEAAGLYEKVSEKLKDGWKYAPQFPPEGKHWTKEMRHAQAHVLKETLALERKAVDELKAVLE